MPNKSNIFFLQTLLKYCIKQIKRIKIKYDLNPMHINIVKKIPQILYKSHNVRD